MLNEKCKSGSWLVRAGVHEKRGAKRGQVGRAACGLIRRGGTSLRSFRGVLFFWFLFFWTSKRKGTDLYQVTTRGHVYVSNDSSTLVEVYFDDVVVTQTKTNLIQGNEYYPFGMQTANSWTREAVTGNNYLANGGTELNTTTQLYDLDFRNYDPALGRMYGVDPMAAKYASLTPYNYSFNNPTAFSDVSGADPNETVNYSAMNGQYYSAYTYDDKIESRQTAVWYDAMGWRNEVPGGYNSYAWATGTGGSMGRYWHAGDGRMFWSGYESYARGLRNDADMVRYGEMSVQQYGQRNGISISTEQLRYMAYAHNVLGINPVTGVRYTFMTAPSSPSLHVNSLNVAFASINLVKLPTNKVQGPDGRGRIYIVGNNIYVNGRNLNPNNKVLANYDLKLGIANLYKLLRFKLNADFQFEITGGDRYLAPTMVSGFKYSRIEAFSSTNNSLIFGSGPNHVGGWAADIRIKWMDNSLIPVETVRPLLIEAGLRFEDGAMPSDYPKDNHYHLVVKTN